MKQSIKEDDRPSFSFYVKDWLTDTGLVLCGPVEKGIWIDMLCYMFSSPVRGAMLNPDGSIMDGKTMAKLLRVDEKCIKNALGKLMANGVARKLENGTIVNWRMYAKDKDLSQKRRESGVKGALAKWEKKEGGDDMANGMARDMANDGKDGLPQKQEKKNKYLEFVYLSLEEFKKLEERFGKEITEQMIERLNNYIGSKGKKYRSHYHTILSWRTKDEKEKKEQKPAEKPDYANLKKAKIILEKRGKGGLMDALRLVVPSQFGELKEFYCRIYPGSEAARSFSLAQDKMYAEIEEKRQKLSQLTAGIGK